MFILSWSWNDFGDGGKKHHLCCLKLAVEKGGIMSKKVLLGMSGGVDSSVSALLLKEAGYEVIGVTLNLFPCTTCCSYIDVKDVCRKIGIEHFIYDGVEDFEKHVIQDFISEYKQCRTPNPCIECNKYMKFGAMYEKANELGCDYIATGHYAKIEWDDKYKQNVLKKSKADKKDQSYVVYNLPREMLDKVLFPLGDFTSKDQIRKIAEEHNLSVAHKSDSEDICFIPNKDYKTFLENNSDIEAKQGNIVNLKGEKLGTHTGLYKYTIGQRKGLGISNPVPLFVVGYNQAKNELIVGEEKDLYKTELYVTDINLLLVDKLEQPLKVNAKIRYAAKEAPATITQVEPNKIKVEFDQPQKSITPGQSVVFYVDDIVLGGGKIL